LDKLDNGARSTWDKGLQTIVINPYHQDYVELAKGIKEPFEDYLATLIASELCTAYYDESLGWDRRQDVIHGVIAAYLTDKGQEKKKRKSNILLYY